MGFLLPLSFFGFDLLGFLQGKKKSPTVLDNVSYLQTFKSLTSDVAVSTEVSQEAELEELTGFVANRLGQEEMAHISQYVVGQHTLIDIAKASVPPQAGMSKTSIDAVGQVLELPQSLIDFVENN